MKRLDLLKHKEQDRFNLSFVGSFFIFFLSGTITDNIPTAIVLVIVFNFALSAFHDKIYRKLNGDTWSTCSVGHVIRKENNWICQECSFLVKT